MANITKTQGTSVLSLQSVASNTVLISSDIDVSTKLAATVFIHFGRRATTALTAGMEFRLEASAKSSGSGYWWPVATFTSAIAAAESETVLLAASGQKVLTMASTNNLVVGDVIFIDNGTIGSSEWAKIKSVSAGVSITVEDDLVNAQTSSVVYDQAELYVAQIDLTAIGRLRLVANGASTGQAVAVEALIVTGDSIG